MWSGKLRLRLKSLNNLNHIIVRNSQIAAARVLSERPSDVDIFKVGEKVFGFEVKKVENVPDFRVIAIHLVHDKSKAEYLHLYRNDTNNVFSINFRTTPLNNTGLPHILEHTVLCGSQLYPVRDPFFKMLNRSLATFLNAMTGSDYTIYPFSTQNLSDYTNLQKIYLDAVFRPSLKEIDFMQEGWRLENVDLNDVKSNLIIKGVVYNEMKGVFSENENIFNQKLQNLILPDHTYGFVSGGDPLDIPNLTWDDLRAFHKSHYHPSNAKFYSYGNFPLAPTLKYIDYEYLKDVTYVEPTHTLVPKQKRWEEPRRGHINARFENMKEPFEKQNVMAISLLLSDVTDIYDTFLMHFVSHLLIKGPNSPFYKSMIDPNFSGGFIPSTGLDTQPRDSIFTIGLQGLKVNDFDKVIQLFDKTLEDVVNSGFDKKHIDSVLHLYEISVKHETSNFGLHLLFSIAPIWNHNGEILNSLQINKLIDRLKIEISKDPKYLQNVVRMHFKDNRHRLILSMSPDKEYEKNFEKMEKEMIASKIKKLSDNEKAVIHTKCLTLQKELQSEQNVNILPTLLMDDISDQVERVSREKVKFNSIPLQVNKVNTNGIVYFKSLLSTVDLSPEQQMLLPLFCYIINKLGTNSMDYREFDNLVNRKTAGLQLSPHIGESLFHLHSYEPGILLSSYCLEKNVDSMWTLWAQIFTINELKDVERFKMLVQLYMANLTQGLADSGHIYAMQCASGLVSASAYQKDQLSGLQHISYMKRLIQTSNYKAVLDEIVNIAKSVFSKNNMRCALNIIPESQLQILKSFDYFLKDLPNTPRSNSTNNLYVTGKVWAPTDAIHCQHHILNVPVNYCSKAILTVPYNNSDYAKLKVLARLLSAKYLHPEIREKQGAYGGGARITQGGVFVYYSYRDPRNLETLDIFDNSYKWLENALDKVTDQEILEAKLGVFQGVDAPVAPANKGCDEFLHRLTPDILQRHRADIMIVDQKGLKLVSEKYLGNDQASLNGKVILGPKAESFNTASRSNELWTVIDNV